MIELGVQVIPIPLDVIRGSTTDIELGSPNGEFSGTDEEMQALTVNALANIAREEMHSRVDAAYLVRWATDFRTPIGAQIGSHVIAATRHGMVFSSTGKHFGLYERIREAQGRNDQNEMLILAFGTEDEIN
jgi:hypothetical protein